MDDKNTTLHQAKDTGMSLVLICLILFLFSPQRIWVVAALIFLLIGMVCPKLYRPAAVIWFKLSHFLGGIASTVVLTIIFFVVLTPIGLLRKLTGADAMKLKKWKTPGSAFKVRDTSFSAADLKKPY